MIVCKGCGERQGDDAVFCGRCGAFLEWEGERVTRDAHAPQGAREPRGREPTPAGAETLPASEPASGPDSAPTSGLDSVPLSGSEPVPAPEPGPQWSDARESMPPDAPTTPEHTSSEEAATVAARQPGQARARPRSPAPRRVERLPSGTRICGGCGAGNSPSRRFCERCGHSLADAAVVVRPPWWRRLILTERTYVAGTRRRPRHLLWTAFRLVVLAALVVAVFALVGPLRPDVVGAYHGVVNMVLPPKQVRPVEVAASAAVDEHGAEAAFDGATNTYWAAPAGEGVPWLRARLSSPVHMVAVGVSAGTSKQTPEFLAAPRPSVVEIAATTGAGVEVRRLTLEDNPGFQKLTFDVADVRALRISAVSSKGSTADVTTAVTEVEFFARR